MQSLWDTLQQPSELSESSDVWQWDTLEVRRPNLEDLEVIPVGRHILLLGDEGAREVSQGIIQSVTTGGVEAGSLRWKYRRSHLKI